MARATTTEEVRDLMRSKVKELERQLKEREPEWFKAEIERLEAQYREQIVNLQLKNSEMATRLENMKSALLVILNKL